MKMKRVINKRYTFYITVKNVFLKINTSSDYVQKFAVVNFDDTNLSGQQHLDLIDLIYRRKIVDTATLGEHLMSKHKLVSTYKNLK